MKYYITSLNVNNDLETAVSKAHLTNQLMYNDIYVMYANRIICKAYHRTIKVQEIQAC